MCTLIGPSLALVVESCSFSSTVVGCRSHSNFFLCAMLRKEHTALAVAVGLVRRSMIDH